MGSTPSKMQAVSRAIRAIGQFASRRSRCTCEANRGRELPPLPEGAISATSAESDDEMSSSSSDNRHLATASTAGGTHNVPETLECPICYYFMYKPIYTCVNGHSICGDCQSRINNCPFCRTEPIHIRDYDTESWACSFYIPCRYEQYGCKEAVVGRKLRKHLANCVYRHLECSMCELNIASDEFWYHLNRFHSIQARGASEFTTRYVVHMVDFAKDEFRWNPRWLTCYKTNFLCHFEKFENEWCLWISAEENWPLFSCKISYFSSEQSKQITYDGPVNEMRVGRQTVSKDGLGLVLDSSQVQSFLTETTIANITFRILQVPEGEATPQPNTFVSKYKAPEVKEANEVKVGPHCSASGSHNIPATPGQNTDSNCTRDAERNIHSRGRERGRCHSCPAARPELLTLDI